MSEHREHFDIAYDILAEKLRELSVREEKSNETIEKRNSTDANYSKINSNNPKISNQIIANTQIMSFKTEYLNCIPQYNGDPEELQRLDIK